MEPRFPVFQAGPVLGAWALWVGACRELRVIHNIMSGISRVNAEVWWDTVFSENSCGVYYVCRESSSVRGSSQGPQKPPRYEGGLTGSPVRVGPGNMDSGMQRRTDAQISLPQQGWTKSNPTGLLVRRSCRRFQNP